MDMQNTYRVFYVYTHIKIEHYLTLERQCLSIHIKYKHVKGNPRRMLLGFSSRLNVFMGRMRENKNLKLGFIFVYVVLLI